MKIKAISRSFLTVVVLTSMSGYGYRRWIAAEDRRAFALDDEPGTILHDRAAHPRPLRPIPLDGFVISGENRAALLAAVTHQCKAKGTTNGILVHAIRLRSLIVRSVESQDLQFYDKVLELFLDSQQYQRWAPDAPPLLFDTPFGAVYRTNNTGATKRPYAGGMMHVDDVLSALAELGLPLDRVVITNSGRRQHLADVLEDSLHRWKPTRESDFSFIAYCDYLGDQNTWPSADGQKRSLSDVLEAIMRQPPPGTCMGTHRLYAVAKACMLSREASGMFSANVIRDAEFLLRDASRQLALTQRADGAWSDQWRTEPNGSSVARGEATPFTLIAVTGHMLEWFAIAAPDLRPPPAVIARAARYVEKELLQNSEMHFGGPQLAAVTHAIRGLLHLSSVPDYTAVGARQ